MSTSKKEFAARVLDASGLGSLLLRLKTWRGLLTLNYHRVGDSGATPFDPEVFSATAAEFDIQIGFLKTRCDVIVPDDLETARHDRRGRFVMITFDDAYLDNFEVAFPILRTHRFPATFFIPTGFLDRPRIPWWDEIAWMTRVSAPITIPGGTWLREPLELDPARPDSAILRLNRLYHQVPPPSRDAYLDFLGEASGRGRCGPQAARDLWMTWDMVRQLQASGMALGGHTHEHVMLSEQSPSRQRGELETSLRRIEEETNVRPGAISYPYGTRDSFDQITRVCLDQAAVRYAFSFYGGYCRFDDWDPYDIPRIGIDRSFALPRFRGIVAWPRLRA